MVFAMGLPSMPSCIFNYKKDNHASINSITTINMRVKKIFHTKINIVCTIKITDKTWQRIANRPQIARLENRNDEWIEGLDEIWEIERWLW